MQLFKFSLFFKTIADKFQFGLFGLDKFDLVWFLFDHVWLGLLSLFELVWLGQVFG